jgi:epoxyqueuosine reductase
MRMIPSQIIKARSAELGFNLVGLTRAEPSPRLDAYFRWIDAQMHGEMGYLAREDRQARRRDLNAMLPGAQSMIMVGLDYHALNLPDSAQQLLSDPSRGRIAAYAWGLDYHDLMTPRLETLANWLRDYHDHTYRVYVDTGAILERSHAQQAGLGFTGKNTMLINPRRGSYFFLGEILTDMIVDAYDEPHRESMCGSCTRCQTACPTQAFPKPYVLDSRRCISYLTIEHKGWIDRALRPLIGNWIYGCDVCQDVCPFTRFAEPTHEAAFLPADQDRIAPSLLDLLSIDEAGFRVLFAGSPILRIQRDRLVRNACIAAGNWGNEHAIPALTDLLRDPSPLIRGHAIWALSRILGARCYDQFTHLLAVEPDPAVQAELWAALATALEGL